MGKLSHRIRFLYLPWLHFPASFNSSDKKNICRAVFLLLHQHFPFLEEKYLINFSFVQRDLVFCFFSPWRWKIMRPLIFWFPQCMAHENSSFYCVELNRILFFLISENFNFSAHCALYFRTEGVCFKFVFVFKMFWYLLHGKYDTSTEFFERW